MILDARLWICVIGSVAAHYAVSRGLDGPQPAASRPAVIQVQLTAPPPLAPEIVVPPAPPPVPVPRRVSRAPRAMPPVPPSAPSPIADDAPAPPTAIAEPAPRPRFGVSIESVSRSGGPAMPVGDPRGGGAEGGERDERGGALDAARPVPAVEVTRMPVPMGRCAGTYTAEARAAAIEGVVVLDLVVDASGRARDIAVVGALSHGLTEAAVRAVADCRFTPGERKGLAVAVRVRGFKIRFLLEDGG